MTKQCEKVVFDDFWGYEVEVYDAVFGSCELTDTMLMVADMSMVVAVVLVVIAVVVGLARR